MPSSVMYLRFACDNLSKFPDVNFFIFLSFLFFNVCFQQLLSESKVNWTLDETLRDAVLGEHLDLQ